VAGSSNGQQVCQTTVVVRQLPPSSSNVPLDSRKYPVSFQSIRARRRRRSVRARRVIAKIGVMKALALVSITHNKTTSNLVQQTHLEMKQLLGKNKPIGSSDIRDNALQILSPKVNGATFNNQRRWVAGCARARRS